MIEQSQRKCLTKETLRVLETVAIIILKKKMFALKSLIIYKRKGQFVEENRNKSKKEERLKVRKLGLVRFGNEW